MCPLLHVALTKPIENSWGRVQSFRASRSLEVKPNVFTVIKASCSKAVFITTRLVKATPKVICRIAVVMPNLRRFLTRTENGLICMEKRVGP